MVDSNTFIIIDIYAKA